MKQAVQLPLYLSVFSNSTTPISCTNLETASGPAGGDGAPQGDVPHPRQDGPPARLRAH